VTLQVPAAEYAGVRRRKPNGLTRSIWRRFDLDAEFERNLPQGCGNGSNDAASEIRKASRARAPDSPSPGEGRTPEWPGQTKKLRWVLPDKADYWTRG
jgi:hypothetical protein